MRYSAEQAGDRLTRFLRDREAVGQRLDSRRGDLAAELADLTRAVKGLPPASQEIVKWFIFKGAQPARHGSHSASDLAVAETMREEGRPADADRYLARRVRNRYPAMAELREKLEEALSTGEVRDAQALERTLRQMRVLHDVARGLSGTKAVDLIRRTSGRTCNGPCRRCHEHIDYGEEVWYDRADRTLVHVECPGELPIYVTVVEQQAICTDCGGRIAYRMLCWAEPLSGRFWHCDCLG